MKPISVTPIRHEKYLLGNGLNVILHEDHATPIVAVNLWYHVGSKNERRGKTGFAHFFEHMMFQGSEHHDMDFFAALEPLGATDLNGTTDFDRTNYFETVPAGALEKVLWLEADRMGWLLPAMTEQRIDNQREVVKNERRQSIDNQPYGLVDERMYAVLYPSHHPYSWDVIGYMEDVTAATRADIEEFFRTYYAPGNCTLVIAGDIDVARTKEMVERYFGPIPAGPPVYRLREWVPELDREVRLEMEDRVPLPRLYLAWHMPGYFRPGEAELDVLAGVLTAGKTSRLYQRLVYDLQIAQDVRASVDGREIGSLFRVSATAKDGHTLDEIEPIVLAEIERLRDAGPTAAEVERVRTGILAGFTRGIERIGGFGGRSDRLGMYNAYLGDPDYTVRDFTRYQEVTPASVQAAAERWLHAGRVAMRVVPYPDLEASVDRVGEKRALPPEVGAAGPLRLPALERATLANGLQVVLAHTAKVPLVEVSLLVGGGWSADAPDKPGIASFMSRMQDEGTATRGALAISDETLALGAALGSSSTLDNCRVALNALKARLEPSLELWADIVLNPSFPQEEIERQRQQVLGHILQEKNQPVSMGLRILPGLLYGSDHPYGQPLTGSGTEASVRAVTREDLIHFHETWFRPGNAKLVIVGDTTLAEMLPLLERTLGAWRPGPTPALAIPTRPQPERTRVYLVDKPHAAQSVLLVGHLLAPQNDPSTVEFEVLNAVLGGQFIARINMNLREDKGWSYGAYSFPLEARGQGTWLAYAQVRTDVTKEALAELLREIRDIRTERPVSAEELAIAHDSLTLSLPGQYETISGIGAKVSDIVTFGLREDHDACYPGRVLATTEASLTALAQTHILPDHLVIVVVGDRRVIEQGVASLGLGAIAYLDSDGQPLVMGKA